jgi:hypothetical protein
MGELYEGAQIIEQGDLLKRFADEYPNRASLEL